VIELIFISGFLCGFIGSIPLTGPIALLFFRLVVDHQTRNAFKLLSGATLLEVFYCALATIFFRALLESIPELAYYLKAISAFFLIVLGAVFLRESFIHHKEIDTDESNSDETKAKFSERRPFLTGVIIAGLNPTLIITWASAASLVMSWLGDNSRSFSVIFPLAAGVGIFSWFGVLAQILRKFRKKITDHLNSMILRALSLIMIAAGLIVSVKIALPLLQALKR